MIAVFGASVTQQKNGYAVKLRSKLQEKVYVYGYGGMHLVDAGICFIDQVLKKKPKYCFVDWFTTGYLETNEKTKECIDTIVYKLSKIGCKVIFLFLPHKRFLEREAFYAFCKEHLKTKHIPFIDLLSKIQKYGISLDQILRDNVHTNDYGSVLYASIIAEEFMEMKDKIQQPNFISPPKYVHINRLKVNKIFENSIVIRGRAEIIGFLVTLGPHSGIVEICDKNKKYRVNTWDRWCHFPRKNFQFPMRLNGEVRLNILQDSFDTSECKIDFDFTKYKKKLIVHDIYYVGNYVEIVNINDGKRIPKEYLFLRKILGRVYQKMTNVKNFLDNTIR